MSNELRRAIIIFSPVLLGMMFLAILNSITGIYNSDEKFEELISTELDINDNDDFIILDIDNDKGIARVATNEKGFLIKFKYHLLAEKTILSIVEMPLEVVMND